MTTEMSRVFLTWPTALAVPTASRTSPGRISWVQVAKTGSFVSERYGRFSITPADLRTMFTNFTQITPKAPTRLCVDFDHLSLDPKRPGDGIAAGWISHLDLRNNDTELWARVEWTSEGARRIAAKEYQFISPTFVKNHVYKDGKAIGATLLAAAVTNHPFLEGMAAVTLLSDHLRDVTAPASAESARAIVPKTMTPEHKIELRAQQLVDDSRGRLSFGDAVKTASGQFRQASARYLEQFASGRGQSETVINAIGLHRQPGEDFAALVTRVSRDRRIDLRDASRIVAEAYPTLAAAYGRADGL